jgi:hypothetical protein
MSDLTGIDHSRVSRIAERTTNKAEDRDPRSLRPVLAQQKCFGAARLDTKAETL